MKRLICLNLVIFFVVTSSATAAILRVPRQHPTIQSAIDAAVDGDTVIVAPGTYTGCGNRDIDFLGKAITVRSETGPENCIIDCRGTEMETHRGFYFHKSEDANSILDGFTITNAYSYWGSGIRCTSSPTIINCIIRGNTDIGLRGGGGGGGIGCHFNNNPIIINCIITNNSAIAGGGISGCDGQIINCTITNNKAERQGGGIGGCAGPISNCIIWNNDAPQGSQLDLCADPNYSCIQNWTNGGTGNISHNPSFAFQNDYHLMPDSPCIDASTNELNGHLPGNDVDGNPRPLDGNGDTIAVTDMGAYEYNPNRPSIVISVSEFSFSYSGSWPNPSPQKMLIKNCGGGTLNWEIVEHCDWLQITPTNGILTDQSNEVILRVDPNGLELGEHRFVFTVSDVDAVNSPKTVIVSLHIFGDIIYVPEYVPTIQNAIDHVIEGGTVIVAPGTYTGDGNRDIDFKGKAITVRSIVPNNPNIVAATVIDCNGTSCDLHRGFYFHNGEDANSVLSGFTIINGYSRYGGGIYCKNSSPTIANCVISENATSSDGGGIYLDQSNPILTNCTLENNLGGRYGGGMYSYQSNPKLTKCTISNNEAHLLSGGGVCLSASDPLFEFCIFRANTAARTGGGITLWSSNPTIRNCFIVDNWAYDAWSDGGGIRCWASDPIIVNCIISANQAEYGGGISCGYHSRPIITNCTFTGNTAFYSGGALSTDESFPVISSSILYGNAAKYGNQVALYDSAIIDVNFSDVKDGYDGIYYQPDCILNWGPGNIDGDPLFVEPGYWADANDHNIIVEPDDPNAIWIDGDYHLLPESPCIDAGDPNHPYNPNETDFDGNPRVFENRIDMGVYEFNLIEVQMQITPKTLNCKSKGNWIKAHIILPEEIPPEDIDVDRPAVAEPLGVESEYIEIISSNAGPTHLEIGFNKQSFCKAVTEDGVWQIELLGRLKSSRYFIGIDTISVNSTFGSPAYEPYPADGAMLVDPNTFLSWTPGYKSVSHDVYLGTSFEDINSATIDSDEYMGNCDVNICYPGSLEWNTTYYWRIDELIASSPSGKSKRVVDTIKGDIWSFTTAVESVDPNVAWWTFDEDSGSTVYDSVGDNDGTIYGAQRTSGWLNGALYFDGIEDRVEIPHSNSLSLTSEITISAWIKPNSLTASNKELVAKAVDNNPKTAKCNYDLRTTDYGKLQFLFRDSDNTIFPVYQTSDAVLAADTWSHICATHQFGNANNTKIYVDSAAQVATWIQGIGNETPMTGSYPLEIAAFRRGRGYLSFSNFFDGRIDDVRIYGRILSDNEVLQLYQEFP